MSIPEHLSNSYKRTIQIIDGFIKWLSFCVIVTGKNSKFKDNHLLYLLSDDYLESISIVPHLIEQGIHRPVIRESRFILEMSIKMALIQQAEYKLPIDKKINDFKNELKSPNISIMRKVDLFLLSEGLKDYFFEETGRTFGYSSKYVHLSPDQISKRASLIQAGRSIANESEFDLNEINDFLERILSCSIVFMMHSVPSYIAGDWLVERDGSTIDWYFVGSRFIADIDKYFDYKCERQEKINGIIDKRTKMIKF
ncbi:hypothetical protein HNQ81_003280 [Desulfoprunum benzoelyticum]|uniref:Uncharacterized protein n=2 Tax=Desulfoprunum benzoelyticum TaxID=1506996 RepID=A0A840V1I2_9BACT|nr:hypothetical protein [Desulfoprunum benzoelyticum]MBB5349524.1 hypothetical protein [Desulfoprunum benzoelyticum]